MVEMAFVVDKIDADLAVESKINALGPGSLSDFFNEVAVPWFVERAEDRFEGEGDDAVGSWIPLAYPTQQIRKATGYPPASPINVRTGDLRDYVTDSLGDVRATTFTASLKWPDATPPGLLGSKVRTAQKGSKTKNTPARPVIAMNETDAAQVTTALTAWVSAFGTHGLEIL